MIVLGLHGATAGPDRIRPLPDAGHGLVAHPAELPVAVFLDIVGECGRVQGDRHVLPGARLDRHRVARRIVAERLDEQLVASDRKFG